MLILAFPNLILILSEALLLTSALNYGINFRMSSWPIMLIFLSLSYDQFCCSFYIFLFFFVIFIICYIHVYIDYRLYI